MSTAPSLQIGPTSMGSRDVGMSPDIFVKEVRISDIINGTNVQMHLGTEMGDEAAMIRAVHEPTGDVTKMGIEDLWIRMMPSEAEAIAERASIAITPGAGTTSFAPYERTGKFRPPGVSSEDDSRMLRCASEELRARSRAIGSLRAPRELVQGTMILEAGGSYWVVVPCDHLLASTGEDHAWELQENGTPLAVFLPSSYVLNTTDALVAEIAAEQPLTSIQSIKVRLQPENTAWSHLSAHVKQKKDEYRDNPAGFPGVGVRFTLAVSYTAFPADSSLLYPTLPSKLDAPAFPFPDFKNKKSRKTGQPSSHKDAMDQSSSEEDG